MGEDLYEKNSLDAVISRIETKLDQHTEKLDKITDYVLDQAKKITSLEETRIANAAATSTAYKIVGGIGAATGVVSGIVGSWLASKWK